MNHERRQRAFVVFTVSASCFGLLLWARLLLVTNYPRTATASPTHEAIGYELPRPIPRLPAPAKKDQVSPQVEPPLPADQQPAPSPASGS